MAQTFSEFLVEAGKVWTLGDFGSCLTASNRRYERHIEKDTRTVVEKLNRWQGAEGIPNPEFVAFKLDLSTLVDRVCEYPEWLMDAVIRGTQNRHEAVGTLYYDCRPSGYSEVAGKLKKTEAIAAKNYQDTDVQAVLGFLLPKLRELAPACAVLAGLKSKIVKRQPKAPEDKAAKYLAPMASKAAGKVILDALTQMSQRIYDGVKQSLIDDYTEQAQRLNVASIEMQQAHVSMDVFKLDMWDRVGEPVDVRVSGSYMRRRVQKLQLNGKSTAAIAALAKDQADDMQKEFTVKNASKLASIVDKKQGALVGNPVILSAGGFRGGRFECELRVQFVDGSQFDVKNQVVLKRSPYGKLFMQYPTTFHNVKLPAGVSMGMPSEERMNTVFAKA